MLVYGETRVGEGKRRKCARASVRVIRIQRGTMVDGTDKSAQTLVVVVCTRFLRV